jgi:hypothetical protein
MLIKGLAVSWKTAWEAFRLVVDNFLGNQKTPTYSCFVDQVPQAYSNGGMQYFAENTLRLDIRFWISFQQAVETSATNTVKVFIRRFIP